MYNCRTNIGVIRSVVITAQALGHVECVVSGPCLLVCALEVMEIGHRLLCVDTASRQIVLLLVNLIVLYGCFDI